MAAERLGRGLNTLCWPQNAGRVQVGLKVTNELSISRFAGLVFMNLPPAAAAGCTVQRSKVLKQGFGNNDAFAHGTNREQPRVVHGGGGD